MKPLEALNGSIVAYEQTEYSTTDEKLAFRTISILPELFLKSKPAVGSTIRSMVTIHIRLREMKASSLTPKHQRHLRNSSHISGLYILRSFWDL